MSAEQFCIRVCKDGPRAPALCQHIYDVMGCAWNMPGNYDAGTFERCQGDTGEVRASVVNLVFCIDIDFDYQDRKSTRLNSSHSGESRMPSSA